MLKLILGAAAGVLAAWLARSGRAREEARRRVSEAPEPVRRATQSVASAAASRVERAAEAVAGAPLPGPVRDAARRAAAAAQRAGGPPAGGAGIATLYLQELPDGAWVGEVAWGGRTLHEGAAEPQAVIRRLASHLAGVPEAGRPARVKLVRVSQAGAREEREEELASVLA